MEPIEHSEMACPKCGHGWEDAWETISEVWTLLIDRSGEDCRCKAVCNHCGYVEWFTCSGGQASPYPRSLDDIGRKHKEAHNNGETQTKLPAREG